MKPSALTALLDGLSPAQRGRLLAIQPAATRAVLSPAKARRRTAADIEASARRDGDVVTVQAKGLRLVNALNAREHWRAASTRAAAQRALVGMALVGVAAPAPPLVVTITRQGPRRLDDDGATASAKHVRDAVAAWLGVDDGNDRVTYRVGQQIHRGYGVVITIVPGGGS